jgi:molybdopterin/thiamine biosynthesis adenylyltransferase
MLRIEESMWQSLIDHLSARTDVETAALILAAPHETGGGDHLVAREVKLIPEDGYRIRRIDQLSIDPIAINRLVRTARERRLSILTVHSHPMAREAWFSRADDLGDARILPSFAAQVPGVPHGALVVAGSCTVAARVAMDGRLEPLVVRVVGRRLITVTASAPDSADARFDRQVLALGAHGQAVLRGLTAAVIGAGGVGSVVAVQLAHLGIGGLVLIDGDVVQQSNTSRIIAARPGDVGRVAKTVVAQRYIEEMGFPVRVRCHQKFLARCEDLGLLAGCDVVFSCVDRQTPRAILNRFAYEALVPMIDLGTAFRVDGDGTMVGAAGRVVVVGPGRPCLSCWGHIDPAALRREALSLAEREAEAAEGYIDGAEVPQPSVIPFNTMVAGAGAIELLRLVTGFAGADDPPNRLSFRFDEGTVRRNTVARNSVCKICGAVPVRSGAPEDDVVCRAPVDERRTPDASA